MKKGFTLIELLAVIVILAIIALIATPIILGIINSTRVSANERSAELYIDAVEQAVVRKNLSGEFSPTQCTIENSVVTCDGEELDVAVDREKPITGIIIFEDGLVKPGTTLNYKDFTVTVNENNKIEIGEASGGTTTPEVTKPCTRQTDADGFDTVTCGTESFYVMNSYLTDVPSDKIVMLTKYNLNVGDNAYTEGTIGIQNENVIGDKSGYLTYGTVAFSNTNYWSSGGYSPAGDSSYSYVYDSNSNLYPIVEGYVSYLNSNGVSGATGKLLSYEQAEDLGCSFDYSSYSYSCKSAPEWVYSTSYWSGSSERGSFMQYVHANDVYTLFDYDTYNTFGVRPVITISVSNLG